jgi:hypothetical protein
MFEWIDKQDDIDYVLAKDINAIAHELIALRKDMGKGVVDQTFNPTSENAQSGKAVAEAIKAVTLKGTKSGTIISANDVSPIEHNLGIKLSSDTITDFSNVNVTRLGKNLINIPNLENVIGDGTIKVLYRSNEVINCGGNQTFLSCTPVIDENFNASSEGHIIYANITFADGFVGNFKMFANNGSENGQLLPTRTNGDIVGISIIQHSRFISGNLSITNIQLELGDTATEYEPYNPQTVTANADGTVEGLTSLSPNVTLYSDTYGVNINLEYNRDINKAFAQLEQAILNSI